MRVRWWQSIRWRLALGSVLLALLTTSSLALIAVIVVNNNYGQDQQKSLRTLVDDKAQSIATNYDQQIISHPQQPAQGPRADLHQAATDVIHPDMDSNNLQPHFIVLNRLGLPVYPSLSALSTGNPGGTATTPLPTAPSIATANPTVQAQHTATAVANAIKKARATSQQKRALYRGILQLIDPAVQPNDDTTFERAIQKGLNGTPVDGAFGRDNPVGNAQPFAIQPIIAHASNKPLLIGILIATTPSTGIPAFVATVGVAVFIASLGIAGIAALAAILFSQTLMNPLAKLTSATRVIASGNYDAQVTTRAPGELAELSHNFNEMAAQLKQDVEELRRQEVWRRELIMNITHDLATPLTAIAGLGESLMDGVNQSREDYEATGRIIMHETLRLRRLVQDLHVMAKVEAGALQPKLKPLRLAALVDETLAVLAPQFERHQVEPNNAIPFQLPPVQADADMLTRVFSNLCNNALRHTPAGGTVTINAIVQGEMLLVSVTDTGEGIPEEALPRVFERFYRADSSRQSSTGGSGLGLAIVKAIIEAHGGTIWAANAPGAGACISFTLPLRISGQPPLADDTTQPMSRKQLRSARLTRVETPK